MTRLPDRDVKESFVLFCRVLLALGWSQIFATGDKYICMHSRIKSVDFLTLFLMYLNSKKNRQKITDLIDEKSKAFRVAAPSFK